MKHILVVFFFFTLQHCSKPKTVLICGDHVCVNKLEAEQFFEENLSIEVQIIDKNNNKEINLVELNLNSASEKQISINKKNNTKKDVKALNVSEIKKIKKEVNKKKENKKIKKVVNKKKENKKIVKKIINNKKDKKDYTKNNKILKKKAKKTFNIDDNKQKTEIADVCTIIQKCSIHEISKYLLEQGEKKDFPDITARE